MSVSRFYIAFKDFSCIKTMSVCTNHSSVIASPVVAIMRTRHLTLHHVQSHFTDIAVKLEGTTLHWFKGGGLSVQCH